LAENQGAIVDGDLYILDGTTGASGPYTELFRIPWPLLFGGLRVPCPRFALKHLVRLRSGRTATFTSPTRGEIRCSNSSRAVASEWLLATADVGSPVTADPPRQLNSASAAQDWRFPGMARCTLPTPATIGSAPCLRTESSQRSWATECLLAASGRPAVCTDAARRFALGLPSCAVGRAEWRPVRGGHRHRPTRAGRLGLLGCWREEHIASGIRPN